MSLWNSVISQLCSWGMFLWSSASATQLKGSCLCDVPQFSYEVCLANINPPLVNITQHPPITWECHPPRTWEWFSCSLTWRMDRGLDFYALVISNKRTTWTLTFIKTMAVFSTVCHGLLYTAIDYAIMRLMRWYMFWAESKMLPTYNTVNTPFCWIYFWFLV